jgi:hypothetical protein
MHESVDKLSDDNILTVLEVTPGVVNSHDTSRPGFNLKESNVQSVFINLAKLPIPTMRILFQNQYASPLYLSLRTFEPFENFACTFTIRCEENVVYIYQNDPDLY